MAGLDLNDLNSEEIGLMTVGEQMVFLVDEKLSYILEMNEREPDLKLINGNFTVLTFMFSLFGSMFQNDLNDESSNIEWFLTFSGSEDGFAFMIFMIPIICAQVFLLLLNGNPPIYQEKGFDAANSQNVPTVPLTFLQQAKLEAIHQRPKRNTVEWYGNKFIIRVSNNLMNLRDLTIPIVPPEETSNPWKRMKGYNRFDVLFKRSRSKTRSGKLEGLDDLLAEESRRHHHHPHHHHGGHLNPAHHHHHHHHHNHQSNPSSMYSEPTVTDITESEVSTDEKVQNLLDEAKSEWQSQLVADVEEASSKKTISYPPPPERKPVHDHAELDRKIELEQAQLQKEIDNRAQIYQLVEKVEEKLNEPGKQQVPSQPSTSHHHQHGKKKSHHHTYSKSQHSQQLHSAHPHHGQEDSGGRQAGSRRTVQFHGFTKVRILNSGNVHAADHHIPLKAKTPEQIKSMHSFLINRSKSRHQL